MTPHSRLGWIVSVTVLLAALFVLPGTAIARASVPGTPAWLPIPDAERSATTGLVPLSGPGAQAPVYVVLSLKYSNAGELAALLAALSDRSSPLYHHYLTQSQFDARYSPSPAVYASLVQYVSSHGGTNIETYSDRTAISFSASPAAVSDIFHTTLGVYDQGGRTFESPVSAPELPADLAPYVVGVEGLSTSPQFFAHLGTAGAHAGSGAIPGGTSRPLPSGFLPPANYQGIQLEYSPDFQVSYDLSSLLTGNYPTKMVVATILWAGSYTGSTITTPCGSLTSGQALGGFDPKDIGDFFNETIPTGEPHALYAGVPINGAPAPSCLAAWDTSGADFENTLDLESVGAMAPGAHVFNIYGPSNSYAQLDADLTYILSANPATTMLGNVSVISNSWYGGDTTDATWDSDLQQAQARGITVLACTGDSDDNVLSTKYPGTNPAFPSTNSYATYGDTGVGGTTVAMNAVSLALAGQVVWNISAADTGDGGPAGSEGGVSALVAEPSWQLSTEANNVTKGAGRGVPDVAAVGNNTLITITVNGYQYIASNASSTGAFYWAWGTSIATPITAGMVAAMDNNLTLSGGSWLGFLNPQLYPLASREANSTAAPHVVYDVTSGSNYADSALPGYDLVTGWGTIDAANFTKAVQAASAFSISSFTATPTSFALGASTLLTVTTSGGVAPFSYSYLNLPAGCTSVNASMLTCTPTTAGNYSVTVAVSDSGHPPQTLTQATSFTVQPAPGGVTISAFTATPSTVHLGGSTYLNVTASGGTGPLTYAYSRLPTGCLSANVSSLKCTPTATGNFTAVTVNVTDSKGVSATDNAVTVTVDPAIPLPPTIASFTATPSSIPLGGSSFLNVTASGGVSPYTYQYPSLPAGCTSANTSSLKCTPTAAGTYTVSATVRGANGLTSASKTATLTVTAVTPPLAIASFSVSPANVTAGNAVTFTVSASGGTGALSYSYAGLPTGCATQNAASFQCSPSQAGTFTVTVTVADTSGHSAQATTHLTVQAAGTGSSNSTQSIGSLVWILLIAVVVAVVVVVIVLVARRRRPSPGYPR